MLSGADHYVLLAVLVEIRRRHAGGLTARWYDRVVDVRAVCVPVVKGCGHILARLRHRRIQGRCRIEHREGEAVGVAEVPVGWNGMPGKSPGRCCRSGKIWRWCRWSCRCW